MNRRRQVVLLGATGSIGGSAASVLLSLREEFAVYAVAACSSIEALAARAVELQAGTAITADPSREAELRSALPAGIAVASGAEAMEEIVTRPEVDIVLCSIIGIGGLRPVLAALRAGKRVALASKEVMVMAGELVLAVLAEHPEAELIPVDSEHSGVFQGLTGREPGEVVKVWLTASGGPFRQWSADRIFHASPADALAHPTWNMGRKITVDSASMMNKALELVEAKYLFNLSAEQLGVVINPQSIVHALVELADGSQLAQLAVPDMRLPVAYALTWPRRDYRPERRLSLAECGKLEFFAPDTEKFPALLLGMEAVRRGGTLPAVMNAADEVAVARFFAGEIPFGGISQVVAQVMAALPAEPQQSLEQLYRFDARARELAAGVSI